MKLKEVLDGMPPTNNDIQIEYRTKADMFAGACKYNQKNIEIMSLDGKSYSLDDEIKDYEVRMTVDENIKLTVWKESEQCA